MISRTDCQLLLNQHQPADSAESADTERALDLVQKQDKFWQADNMQSHLTASCWILNPARDAVLLLHHRKLDRWLQPGGHIEEEDSSWLSAALREAREETGIESFNLIQNSIFDFDIHKIAARGEIPEHQHFDARFLLQANSSELVISTESNDLRWFSFSEAAVILEGDQVMQRMLLKST